MVVIANAVVPYDVPKFLVIDGQQRLMTLTVLLAAIRDRAKVLHYDDLDVSITNNSLTFLSTKGKHVSYIVPRLRDRDTLYGILEKRVTQIDTTLLLAKAYKYFYKEIEQLTPSQMDLFKETNDIVLERIYKAVIQRLEVVLITLDNHDNPSNIYESLNFKHETLADADLIRNYVFMKIGSLDEQETFDGAYWKEFEELFSNTDIKKTLNGFFYRYLICKKGYFAKQRLYTSFSKYVDEFLANNSKKLELLVQDLTKFAKYFVSVQYSCNDSELEVAFDRIRKINTDTAMPLIFSLYERYEAGEITKINFISMLRTIESFILRRFILRERTRGYGLDFAVAINRATTVTSLMDYFVERGWPTDKQVKDELIKFEFYLRDPKYCRFVLSEIEKSYGHKERVDLSDSALTIEHIMPQELTQSWREMLGNDADEKHGMYLNTLGNLTLTGYNSELGSLPFKEKKKEYNKSNLVLNRYFENKNKWAEEEIRERTLVLANKFVDIWLRPEDTAKTKS
jgi:uncharacterized protein with ParB-like and HNH nuclease domain